MLTGYDIGFKYLSYSAWHKEMSTILEILNRLLYSRISKIRQMRRHQKLRSSGLKRSGFLAGALCLVSVCASAQNDPPFTGLSLPLTFSQKFILTNKMLFASSDNQLQDVEIVYAYEPQKFPNIIIEKIKNSELPVSSFKIINPHTDASEDSKRTWDVWQVGDNQIDNALKEIEKKKGFIAISKDDRKRFLDTITDKEDINFINDAKQFFIFKSSRQTQNTRGS